MNTILNAQIENEKLQFLQHMPLMLRITLKGHKEQWQAYFFEYAKKRLKKGTHHKGCEVFSIN